MTALVLINRYARALLVGAGSRGCDTASICRSVSVDARQVDGDALIFGPDSMTRLVGEVRARLQDDFCGLTQNRCKFGSFDLMCELILPSATLGEALGKGLRFFNALSDDIAFELSTQGGAACLQLKIADPSRDPLHFQNEWWLLLWHRLASWLIASEIPILQAEFPHNQSGPIEEYAQVFSHRCHFSRPRARLTFDRQFLAMPVLRDMEAFDRYRASSHIDLVSIPGASTTFSKQVKQQMKVHFDREQRLLSMVEVAQAYNICTQTLRRRLKEEGVNFRGVKEGVQRDMAMRWLRYSDISIAEISELTGFSEPSALMRAIKRWVGQPPAAYRRRFGRRGGVTG